MFVVIREPRKRQSALVASASTFDCLGLDAAALQAGVCGPDFREAVRAYDR